MRERDAQLEYKKKKEEAVKTVDQQYICLQQDVSPPLSVCSFLYCGLGEGEGNCSRSPGSGRESEGKARDCQIQYHAVSIVNIA